MKSILVAMLLIVSSTVFAAPRLPTVQEASDMMTLLTSNKSIQKITNVLKTGTIDPFFDVKEFKIISTPEKSRLTALVILRFSIDSPLGTESENLELLKVLLDLGANPHLDQRHPDDLLVNIKMMTLAVRECAIPVVDMLQTRGVRITSDNFYWVQTAYKGYEYEAGSKPDLDCSLLTSRFLDPVENLTLSNAYFFLSGSFNWIGNDFLKGLMLEIGYSQEIKDKLKEKFDLRASSQPKSAERSDEWFESFKEHFSQPTPSNDRPSPSYYLNWWGKYTAEDKEWACFYSTFDELYPQLKKLGYTDEQIMKTELVPHTRGGAIFGRFAVEVFVPYCNSIRN